MRRSECVWDRVGRLMDTQCPHDRRTASTFVQRRKQLFDAPETGLPDNKHGQSWPLSLCCSPSPGCISANGAPSAPRPEEPTCGCNLMRGRQLDHAHRWRGAALRHERHSGMLRASISECHAAGGRFVRGSPGSCSDCIPPSSQAPSLPRNIPRPPRLSYRGRRLRGPAVTFHADRPRPPPRGSVSLSGGLLSGPPGALAVSRRP